jgi:hypothetical protein
VCLLQNYTSINPSLLDIRDSVTMATSYSSQPPTQAPPTLRELQKKALLRVLNLNAEDDHDASAQPNDLVPGVTKGDPVWKFLVFDKMGQDIISSVLRVSDLREAGVTVHMQLKADRLQMEDVPASTPSIPVRIANGSLLA